MHCKACDRIIEDYNLDETLELCNQCFNIFRDNYDSIKPEKDIE